MEERGLLTESQKTNFKKLESESEKINVRKWKWESESDNLFLLGEKAPVPWNRMEERGLLTESQKTNFKKLESESEKINVRKWKWESESDN